MRMLVLLVLLTLAPAGSAAPTPAPAAPGGLAAALGAPPQPGFARALSPRPFVFPADYGAHPDYRTEWWYFTGNLATAGGRRFGYELTVFRIGLEPGQAHSVSRWRSHQLYMAHFALTDVAAKRFHAYQRISRPVLGLAGAEARPFHVWVDTWSVQSAGAAEFPLRLRASAHGIGIDLLLEHGKPAVAQGDRGLSRKSAQPGNASYYYSLTRMPTRGSIELGDRQFEVSGDSWLDREWSSSVLGADQAGWDWFGLQLSDGSEIMFYRLRLKDGASSPFSAGTLVAPDGSATPLRAADVSLEVLGHWRSPHGGRYPARWRLRVPAAGLDLKVTPLLADQELDLSVRYWEGAVAVSGRRSGKAVRGRGYVELTGYADGR